MRPILDERNAELGKKVDQRFSEVEALLEKYRQGDGFISYDKDSDLFLVDEKKIELPLTRPA